MNKADILGVPVNPETLSSARERILSFIKASLRPVSIYSINPEVIYAAGRNYDFKKILQEATLNIPDGIGVVWAGRFLGYYIPERVAGYDLMINLVEASRQGDFRLFFLGGEPGTGEKAAAWLREKYPDIDIVGIQHGYFSPAEIGVIKEVIKKAAPHILFVGMGFPRQEEFIHEHALELGIPVSIAVGGAFDVLAGEVKRAPGWMQKVGLEWLYRLIKQPERWRRIIVIPLFMAMVLREKFRRRKVEK